MTTVDDLTKAYHQAERRLREMLFGDSTFTAGLVKGEESRLEASRVLRRMRDAFDATVGASEGGRAANAEARIADLEEELRRLASSRSRTRSAPDP